MLTSHLEDLYLRSVMLNPHDSDSPTCPRFATLETTPNEALSVLRPFHLLLFAVAILLAGCGGGSGDLKSVSGKVTVDGRPLTKGAVRFVPDTSKGSTAKFEPVGEIGSDGSYTLSTQG